MSELLGKAAVDDGLNVRGSESLGMAVRGGSVVSTVRVGSGVYGPLIPMGKADILVGMEPAEALRNAIYLSKSSLVLLNTRHVFPFTVSLGQCGYPALDDIIGRLRGITRQVVALDLAQLAEEAGSPLAANVVMLGVLSAAGELPIKEDTIKKGIQSRFSAKLAPINLKAFDLGYQKGREALL